ncbi:MAG: hypothetical protein H0T83_02030 [Chthoniobacterales bacterium]|nr:hypothetical protein [Chthoniobacterales bacterium]
MMRLFSGLALVLVALTTARGADPSLTIYNQNFAVVRGTVPLDLHEGSNEVAFADITSHLEPSSVILRDPTGKNAFRVLQQNYRADAISQAKMLARFEGETFEFLVQQPQKADTVVSGRIVRAGSEDPNEGVSPIIEINGKLRFDLPGKPLFPKLPDASILKPQLSWTIAATQAAKFDAEIAYLSGGLNWSANYNVVVPESGGKLQMAGWITISNQSGKPFSRALVKLVAGEVNKVQGVQQQAAAYAPSERMISTAQEVGPEERSLGDYHLYTLPEPITLRDSETKQVEFVRAADVEANRLYTYDATGYGAPDPIPYRHGPIIDPGWGGDSSTKVGVIYEFKNSEANHLGVPLPKGRWRFYRENGEQLEFTGENEQDHTARDETLRIFTGTAFDLAAERRQADFAVNQAQRTMEEAFEIKLRNHKQEPVEIRVLEHLNRWQSWEVIEKSDPFTKKDASTIEFVVRLKPDEEKSVRYRARYTQLPALPR